MSELNNINDDTVKPGPSNQKQQRTGRTAHLEYKGAPKKICLGCGKKNSVRSQKCECGLVFEKKKKRVEERLPAYKTNITQQTDKLNVIINTLNRDHGQHILVLRAKTHKDADTSFDGIGTLGWAAKFWKEREVVGSPSNLIERAFVKSFNSNNEAEKENESPKKNEVPNNVPVTEDDASHVVSDNSVKNDVPQTETYMKSLTDITPLDVVACYTEDDDADFWLFLVEVVEVDIVKGRWFVKSGNNYILEKRHEISANSLVRIGTDVNMVYVLPKHYPINEYYSLTSGIEKMLIREVSSVD